MSPTGRTNCAEYCPIRKWCADTAARMPGVLESHDEQIQNTTIDVQEMGLISRARPSEAWAAQQAARTIRMALGDRYLTTLLESRTRAANCLRLANVMVHVLTSGCEPGPLLRRVPWGVGATVVGRQCRAPLPEPVGSQVRDQIRNQEMFEKARARARRRGVPDPSPLTHGLYLWFGSPEEET
jgi:hypothetical protein